MVVRLKVDSKALLKKLVERKLSVWEASQELKMDYGNFSRYLKKDKAIRPKTASRLSEVFGDDVVYVAGE